MPATLPSSTPPHPTLPSHPTPCAQYSDKEDGASFHGTPRYYRYALQQLDRAVDAMRAAGVTFALHLGE